MIEIKKCPFCGSSADVIQISTGMNTDGVITNRYKVQCVECKMETKACASSIYQNCVGEVFIRANGAADAIELWNRRKGEAE